MRGPATWLWLATVAFISGGCGRDEKSTGSSVEVLPASPPSTPVAAALPAAPPEIIIDSNHVAIGKEHVPTADRGLTDRAASLLAVPGIEGRAVDVVTMRNVKPSQVQAVLVALRGAKATGATIKTLTREGTTQRLPISFATSTPACATVAWIAKDAAIDVWPAGGGVARRVIRGLAGPDMTLGLEAVRARQEGCMANELVTGGDEAMTWGLVFDLATSALQAPGARASVAILVTSATPGRPVELK